MLPSERSFGLWFSAIFAGIAVYLGWTARAYSAAAAGAIALVLLLLGLWAPTLLAAPNRWWYRFGLLLHAVVSPVVLGLMFLAVIVPVALVLKLCRRDALHRRFDRQRASYWEERMPPGPAAHSFNRQF